jgi:hypothetical protein
MTKVRHSLWLPLTFLTDYVIYQPSIFLITCPFHYRFAGGLLYD